MGTAHAPLPASFSRLLSDAERWAAEGDRDRSRRVLALAAELATPARVPAVLLAWHASGDAPVAPARPASPPMAALAPLVIPELDPAGLPIPDFPTAPPTVDLAAPRGMAPTPFSPPAKASAPAAPEFAEPLPPLEPRSGPGGLLKGIVVLSLVAGAVWMYLPPTLRDSIAIPSFALPTRAATASDAEAALLAGDATRALEIARALPSDGEEAPRGHLVRARALLATGDTAGAVTALTAAAQGDSRGAVAWAAAETLARLPGHATPAADAYLLAFAAGIPADRAKTVARAQELAGRPDRARRVREQAAR